MDRQGSSDSNPFLALVVKEWTIMYYGLFFWKIKKVPSDNDISFRLDKNSAYFWFFIAILHEQVIEMVILHIYVKTAAPLLANVITALHIYSIFYIIGDYNWVRNTPIRFKNNTIDIKIGRRREISFGISDIKLIRTAKLKTNNSGGIIHEKRVFHATAFPRVLTRLFGISDELKHEIIFNKPIYYKGYFGMKKQVDKAFIYIEDSNDFVDVLNKKMEGYKEEIRASQ